LDDHIHVHRARIDSLLAAILDDCRLRHRGSTAVNGTRDLSNERRFKQL
jgi:hypothetical protein